MLTQYGYIAILLLIAIGFGILPLLIAMLIRPKRPNPVKTDIYECGLETIGPTWVQFHVGFYLYALVFVLFDVETVFLYPWAVVYRQLDLKIFALIEMLVFVLLLVVGLVYAWRKRALAWK